jgi:hypothetical protein
METRTLYQTKRGTLRIWDGFDMFDTFKIVSAVYGTRRYETWRRQRGTGHPNVTQLKSMLAEERAGNG